MLHVFASALEQKSRADSRSASLAKTGKGGTCSIQALDPEYVLTVSVYRFSGDLLNLIYTAFKAIDALCSLNVRSREPLHFLQEWIG